MLPFRLVYHDEYDLNLGEHVFPSQKFRLIRERMLEEGFATEEDFVEPGLASDEDLLLAHDPAWIGALKDGTLNYRQLLQLEIPYSRQMVRAFLRAAGGSMLAARLALEHGVAYNIGGGFHHAFPGHGEGFCAIHDVAVAIRAAQRDRLIERALVVDCDVHHGNGTAAIFAHDSSVFTLSIHQLNNYPAEKPPSNIDIHLSDGTGDEEYLDKLREAYGAAIAAFRPQLVAYLAGSDPYREDKLGGLALTIEGLQRRDRLVIETALRHGAAVAIVLAGGYAMRLDDTIQLHGNTAKAALQALGEAGWMLTG